MNIPEYFHNHELACPCCALQKVRRSTLTKLYTLRLLFQIPMILNSACRCPAHNDLVGGSPHSSHLITPTQFCQGFDIRVNDPSYRYHLIRCAMQVKFTHIIIHSTYVHIDDLLTKTQSQSMLLTPGEV
jgi:hypothetical protein